MQRVLLVLDPSIFYTNSRCFCLARRLAFMCHPSANLRWLTNLACLPDLPCSEQLESSDKAANDNFKSQTRPVVEQ